MKKVRIRLSKIEIAMLLNYLEIYWNSLRDLQPQLHHASMLIMAELYVSLYKRFSIIITTKDDISVVMKYSEARVLWDELHKQCPGHVGQEIFWKITKKLVDEFGFVPERITTISHGND